MENLREDLELIEVVYENENKKATLTFLDEEKGQVLEVAFNKQIYDNDKNEYIDDEEKAKKLTNGAKSTLRLPLTSLVTA